MVPADAGAPARPGERSTHDPGLPPFAIRAAGVTDAPRLWPLVREFAAYERLGHLTTGSSERLAAHLAGEAWPRVDALLAEAGGVAAGYALFFGMFSSFWTRPLVWLEDLYVRESYRGRGIGRALLAAVARESLARGARTLDWAVLDWNAAAIAFYERLGARRNAGWQSHRLEGEPLAALAVGGAAWQRAAPGPRPAGAVDPASPGKQGEASDTSSTT